MFQAVGVSGGPNNDYSVSVIVEYDDGTTYTAYVDFATATHDFTFQSFQFTPTKPIMSIVFNCTFQGQGVVYMDNVAYQEKLPGNENKTTTSYAF